jgi:hypothetical protein
VPVIVAAVQRDERERREFAVRDAFDEFASQAGRRASLRVAMQAVQQQADG